MPVQYASDLRIYGRPSPPAFLQVLAEWEDWLESDLSEARVEARAPAVWMAHAFARVRSSGLGSMFVDSSAATGRYGRAWRSLVAGWRCTNGRGRRWRNES